LITIAGSGPSCESYGKPVTIATKKRSLPSEWIHCRFGFQYDKTGKQERVPLLLFFGRCTCKRWYCPRCNPVEGLDVYTMDTDRWEDHWRPFIRKKRLSAHMKPSLGTCAVFAAVEKWGVDEVGVIGLDNILDGNEDWIHDPIAELACIESLVNVVDLRSR
jgi:hypothetical protein